MRLEVGLFFKKRPTVRGEMAGMMPRLTASRARSLALQWLNGTSLASGSSQARATIAQVCSAVIVGGAPLRGASLNRAAMGASASASLLAMILYAKYGNHQPLNRQSEGFAREGIDLSVSTLADQVGAATATLAPLTELIRLHVMGADRLHGDDTTVPVLARSKTITGRLWTYVRDDRPFAGQAPPAAVFFYSRDRAGEHPAGLLADYGGILQADAYAGYNPLYAIPPQELT